MRRHIGILRAVASLPWTNITIAAASIVTAAATVLLAYVTHRYVDLTNELILLNKRPDLQLYTPEAIDISDDAPELSVRFSNQGEGVATNVVLTISLVCSTNTDLTPFQTRNLTFLQKETGDMPLGRGVRSTYRFRLSGAILDCARQAAHETGSLRIEACLRYRAADADTGTRPTYVYGYYHWQPTRDLWTNILDRSGMEEVARAIRIADAGTRCSDRLLYRQPEIRAAD